VQTCDRIIVMHHGELREMGTHNELLGERGLYWRLYQLQYSEEKLHPSPTLAGTSRGLPLTADNA
jgi:ATP-binding cassette, subfamily B, multidrug efflux pump